VDSAVPWPSGHVPNRRGRQRRLETNYGILELSPDAQPSPDTTSRVRGIKLIEDYSHGRFGFGWSYGLEAFAAGILYGGIRAKTGSVLSGAITHC